ncbi:MAG: MaoC family dehydratase N-terminal domain-containing protein [Acidimicrobiales bacterium]
MSYRMPLEEGKVREFARATRSRNQAYQGPDAIVPATFLTHARMAWEPRAEAQIEQLGFDLRRILHGEEEYVFHGPPPRVGQILTVTTHTEDRWEKDGKRGGTMRFARIVNEFRDPDGVLVAEQCSVIVETAEPVKGGEEQ